MATILDVKHDKVNNNSIVEVTKKTCFDDVCNWIQEVVKNIFDCIEYFFRCIFCMKQEYELKIEKLKPIGPKTPQEKKDESLDSSSVFSEPMLISYSMEDPKTRSAIEKLDHLSQGNLDGFIGRESKSLFQLDIDRIAFPERVRTYQGICGQKIRTVKEIRPEDFATLFFEIENEVNKNDSLSAFILAFANFEEAKEEAANFLRLQLSDDKFKAAQDILKQLDRIHLVCTKIKLAVSVLIPDFIHSFNEQKHLFFMQLARLRRDHS